MDSVFSGQTYNPSMNTRTHYEAGRNEPKSTAYKKPNKKKKINGKRQRPEVKAVGVGSYDPSDRYGTMSVFKK